MEVAIIVLAVLLLVVAFGVGGLPHGPRCTQASRPERPRTALSG